MRRRIRVDDKIPAPAGAGWIRRPEVERQDPVRSEHHVELLLLAFYDEVRAALRVSHEIGEAVVQVVVLQRDRLRIGKELLGGAATASGSLVPALKVHSVFAGTVRVHASRVESVSLK